MRKLALWLTVGLTLAGGLVVLAAAWGGGWLMRGVFGEGYAPAGALLPWVLGMLPFALGSVVLVPLLNSLERERGLAVCMGAGGVVLGLVMPWMAMTWGVRGAAIGVALAHAVVFVAGWVLAWEAMRDHAEKSV